MFPETTASATRPTRSEIIAEARSWTGTPYHHHQALRGVAADCIGFVMGVGLALGIIPDYNRVNSLRFLSGYGRAPNPRRMGAGMKVFFRQIPAGHEKSGDIAWIQWRVGMPMHVAILIDGPEDGGRRIIHAYEGAGKVVEHQLDGLWASRVNSWWRFGGMADE